MSEKEDPVKPVAADEDEPVELTDKQVAEAEQGLFDAIAKRVNPNGTFVSRERLALLEKMESYVQAMAEDVCDFFQRKDLEARKRLILKAVEIMKTNPSPSRAGFYHRNSGSLGAKAKV